jgi:integrase
MRDADESLTQTGEHGTKDANPSMPIKLDERTVKDTPAPAKGTTTRWDDKETGFGLRIFAPTPRHPEGARSFFINYRINGIERRLTIGPFPRWSALAARGEAKKLRKRIDKGEDPALARREAREAPTVKDLAERYKVEHLAGKAKQSQANDWAMIENEILPEFGDRKVADVHYGDIKKLHGAITARGAPVRANRVLAVASKMFALSLLKMAGEVTAWRDQAQGNPCKGVERNREEGKERFFSAVEIAALTDAIEAYGETSASNCLRLMMLTGCRPGEAMRATWAEFADADSGVWVKPSAHTKQKKLHRAPLSPAATKFIEQIRAKKPEGVDFVFPGQKKGTPLKQIRTAWDAITDRASVSLWEQSKDEKVAKLVADLGDGATVQTCRAEAARRKIALPVALTDARAYDLRHTFASIGAGGGLSLQIIGRLLGHTQARTTQRYAHLADDPLKEAAAKIGAVIAGAGKDAGNVAPLKRGGA